jgi:hypothetical protein
VKGPRSAPWHPATASWATLFLMPLAGALLTSVNLLRLGRPDKAAFALLLGLASVALLLGLWSQGPAWADRMFLALVVTNLGDVGLFLYLQAPEFRRWRQSRPDAPLAGGWGAAIWALIGFLVTLLLWMICAVLLALLAFAGRPPAP